MFGRDVHFGLSHGSKTIITPTVKDIERDEEDEEEGTQEKGKKIGVVIGGGI